jgi:hypothetical protein
VTPRAARRGQYRRAICKDGTKHHQPRPADVVNGAIAETRIGAALDDGFHRQFRRRAWGTPRPQVDRLDRITRNMLPRRRQGLRRRGRREPGQQRSVIERHHGSAR